MKIEYRLVFPKGAARSFVVHLDAEAHMVRGNGPGPAGWPEWTGLDRWKCPHCSLDTQMDKFCPAATSILPLVEAFGDSLSYEDVDVAVITENRTLTTHASLQNALSSLMGLCLATSGCPTMDHFRPMARYHLPFATEEETQYRVMCMYLLAQFFVARQGGVPDWTSEQLPRLYEEVRVVNKHLAGRLADAARQDANLNALVNLDCFATSVSFTLKQNILDEMARAFESYTG